MSDNIKINFKNCSGFVKEHELDYIKDFSSMAKDKLISGNAQGSEFTGWVNLPSDYDKAEFERVLKASEKIRKNSDIFVVIGIGGSYLGARAVIEALSHNFKNDIKKEHRSAPKIIYAGNNISSTYLSDLLDVLEGSDYSLNVISKSGTTTEPAIAFRILKEKLIEKYGKQEAKNRIFVTTDKSKGALKTLADEEGYETFVVPDEIGGRYSVLTAVGLLPISVAGVDINALMDGAKAGMERYKENPFEKNEAILYASYRNIFNRKGMDIEVLVSYEPQMSFFSQWYKQLFAESDGKDGKGIYPTSVDFSTDLHSVGQYIQDGKRLFFETILNIENPRKDIQMKSEESDLDGLNYLSGKTMNFVNDRAMKGTVLAHVDGNVPNIIINIPKLDAFNLGNLIYFFEFACGVGGYLNGINPFDQPGVESYKKNMFALLGKPGYEEQRAILEARVEE